MRRRVLFSLGCVGSGERETPTPSLSSPYSFAREPVWVANARAPLSLNHRPCNFGPRGRAGALGFTPYQIFFGRNNQPDLLHKVLDLRRKKLDQLMIQRSLRRPSSRQLRVLEVGDSVRVEQNALSQVETFRKLADVTGLVMTKLDGTARGGVLVALADKFGLPIHAIGVGEQIDDLAPFDPQEFAAALTGAEA